MAVLMKFSRVSLALFTWDACPCIKVFQWIRGTGLSWVKRHWPEFGIITGFLWRHLPFCSGGSIFSACDCFGGTYFPYYLFCFLVTDVCLSPRGILVSVNPDLGELISTLHKSKACRFYSEKI